MADHDHQAKPAQPGRADHTIGHGRPSETAIAHRNQQAIDRIARLEMTVTPEAFARRAKDRLDAALTVAVRKAAARKPGS